MDVLAHSGDRRVDGILLYPVDQQCGGGGGWRFGRGWQRRCSARDGVCRLLGNGDDEARALGLGHVAMGHGPMTPSSAPRCWHPGVVHRSRETRCGDG